MKKLLLLLFLAVSTTNCGTPAVLLPVPVPLVDLPFFEPNFDGKWVLTDESGRRTCFTVQEKNVSILNLTCSTDGTGFAARIIEGPLIDGGRTITIDVTYNERTFSDARFQLVFLGERLEDGSYVGRRRDIPLDEPKKSREQTAFLVKLSDS